MALSRQDKLILFCVSLFCIGLVIVTFVWNSNKYYTGAYSPIVKRSIENRKEIEAYRKAHGESSDQPSAPGFREKDIKKERGRGYSTY
jgi:hypothetical protein